MPLLVGTGHTVAPVLMGSSTRPSTGWFRGEASVSPDSPVGAHLADCDCSAGRPCIWAPVPGAGTSRQLPRQPPCGPSPACDPRTQLSARLLLCGSLRTPGSPSSPSPSALGTHTHCGPFPLLPAAPPPGCPAPPPAGGWQVCPGSPHAAPPWAQLRSVRLTHGRLFPPCLPVQACAPGPQRTLLWSPSSGHRCASREAQFVVCLPRTPARQP